MFIGPFYVLGGFAARCVPPAAEGARGGCAAGTRWLRLISLSDTWTFLWWKTRLMLLVPPSSSSINCFNSSKVIHYPCVLESQPVILLDKHCRMFSQLLHFLSYWTPFINPVVRFIDLCSKRWSITKKIVDHWLKLSDFLGFFLDFNAVACAFGLCWLILCLFCFCCFY